ncbi:MAG: hypothetical protein Q4P71_09020 [Actinomycetaceae bacterium]|nr:hypothetical protein [Actinomycetaceae bacterium]
MDDYDLYFEYIIVFDGKTPDDSELTPHWAYSYETAQRIRLEYLPRFPKTSIWVRRTERTYEPWRELDPENEPNPPRNTFNIFDTTN